MIMESDYRCEACAAEFTLAEGEDPEELSCPICSGVVADSEHDLDDDDLAEDDQEQEEDDDEGIVGDR